MAPVALALIGRVFGERRSFADAAPGRMAGRVGRGRPVNRARRRGKATPGGAAAAGALLQRKVGKPGAGLGKTTGWIHRAELKSRGVEMVGSVNYEQIGDQGLLIGGREA